MADRAFWRLVTREFESLQNTRHSSLARVVTGLVRERRQELSAKPEGESGEEDPPTSYTLAIDAWIEVVTAREEQRAARDAAKGTKEAETEASLAWRRAQTTRFSERRTSSSTSTAPIPTSPSASSVSLPSRKRKRHARAQSPSAPGSSTELVSIANRIATSLEGGAPSRITAVEEGLRDLRKEVSEILDILRRGAGNRGQGGQSWKKRGGLEKRGFPEAEEGEEDGEEDGEEGMYIPID